MLQNIRERFTGTFAIVLLVLLGLSFVFFGISMPFLGGGYAARVEGVEIPLNRLENAYQSELVRFAEFGGELQPEIRRMIRQGVLDNLIRETLVDVYLAESGYRVTDQMITDFIQRVPEFQVDGRFSKERYFAWLDERLLTPTMFEEDQRNALRLQQFQRGVGATAFITPADYRRYLNLYGERRRAAIATFDVDAAAEGMEVSGEDIAAYYDTNPSEFQLPESVDLQYVEVDRTQLAQQVELSEQAIRDYYEQSASRYLQDERRQARHILIELGDDENAAEEQARSLAERARAGEPFEDLARQYSTDSGTAEQGGDLTMSAESQLPDALASAIFAMNEGDIVGPVRSDFGFHVIRLDAIEAGGPLPLDQVRAELERELRERDAEDNYRALQRQLSGALFDGLDIEAIAEDAGLELRTVNEFTRAGGEPFGSNQAVIDAVFAPSVLNDGLISEIVELDANRAALFKVAEHNPAAQQPLDEVSVQIERQLRSDRALQNIRERAAQLQEALRDGADILEAAPEAGAEVQPAALYARQSEDADARILEALFRAQKPTNERPTIGTAVTAEGDHSVFIVTAVVPGRPETIPLAERDAGKLQLAQEAGAAEYTAFILELERSADIVRTEDALAESEF
ncbi:MAG: peptidyl-prolyl cis-trans isomerase [Woeseia sp.]